MQCALLNAYCTTNRNNIGKILLSSIEANPELLESAAGMKDGAKPLYSPLESMRVFYRQY